MENRVDFSRPINLVPVAAGIIIAVGDTSLAMGDFSLAGIAFGTLVTILAYHMVSLLMPASMKEDQDTLGTATFADPPGGQNLENLGLADDYGLYGHRILGRTPEGHLIVDEKQTETRPGDPDLSDR